MLILEIKMSAIFVADIIVEKKVLIELKTVDRLVSKHIAQVLNFLRSNNQLIRVQVVYPVYPIYP